MGTAGVDLGAAWGAPGVHGGFFIFALQVLPHLLLEMLAVTRGRLTPALCSHGRLALPPARKGSSGGFVPDFVPKTP